MIVMFNYSRHLRILLWLAGLCLGVLLTFNLLVDPYGSFGLLSRTRFSHSAAGLATPIGKGEMIVRRDWDVLLLGTSRVEASLDPGHPAFMQQRVYNAGLSAADFAELDHAARAAMRHGTLKHLILCVDFFCFDPEWQPLPEVQHSLLNPQMNLVEYKMANLLSLRATEKSIGTFDYAAHHADGPEYPLGLVAARADSPVKNSLAVWIAGGYLRLTIPPGMERSEAWPLSQARFDALSDLLADASRAGVKVDVVQLPMHAICLEGYFAAGRWPFYERWLATLTRLVARHNEKFPNAQVTFWDFGNYDAFAMDPALNKTVWFYDPFHLTIPLGNLVLDRIMHFPPPPGISLDGFGQIMTEANLESHLSQLRSGHEAYYRSNPEMAQFHKAIRASLAARNYAE